MRWRCEGWLGGFFEVEFAWEGLDEGFHFEFDEGGVDEGDGELGLVGDVVDVEFVLAEGLVDEGFVVGEVGEESAVGFVCGDGEEWEEVEFFGDVGGLLDEFGALLDELVAAVGGGAVDVAWDGEDGAALVDGLVGGDEGAAAGAGFDDEGAGGPAADDAVALWEGGFVWGVVDGVFADDGAVGGDAFCEGCVFWWVEFGVAGADDGDGAAFGGECAFVGGGVDAAGEAADDGVAAEGELVGDFFGGVESVGGGVADADDGEAEVVLFGELAADVEDEWGVVDFA